MRRQIRADTHTHIHTGQLQEPSILACAPSVDNNILVGSKHRASEGVFYIGGRRFVCQIIEPVTFACCVFIFVLRNIALDGYLDTRRNI